jgi:hypothetical protein
MTGLVSSCTLRIGPLIDKKAPEEQAFGAFEAPRTRRGLAQLSAALRC